MAAKILVVEDNDKFASLLVGLLERQGFSVERAADGVAALGRVARNSFDVLLLDLRLPRLSGIEVLKKVRQSPVSRHLPVIALSGAYRGEKNVQAVLRLGANAFLEKPFRPAELLDTLKTVLAAPPSNNRPRTFAHILIEAFRTGFSGRYLVGSGDTVHQLTVLRGVPLYLRPGFEHPDFGTYLLSKGLITQAAFDYYRQQADRDHFVFVQMGILEYPDLLQEKLHYLTKELVAGLSHSFEQVTREEHSFPPGLQPITVNVPQILYQGYRRLFHKSNGFSRYESRFAAPSVDYYRYINFLSLTLDDRRLLNLLDGRQPIGNALPEQCVNPMPLLQTLATLGMLRFANTPVTPAPSGTLPLQTLFNRLEDEEEQPSSPPKETLERFDDLLEGSQDFPSPEETPEQFPIDPDPSSVGTQVRQLSSELKGKNYYEMLGISQQKFSFDALKKNYFDLSRQLGPEIIMQLTGEDSTIAEELLANISSAYNTLSDVVKKERYDEMLGTDKIGLGHEGDEVFQAEVQFQSGKVFIEMEDWDGAEKALREASNADQNNGLVLAHLAWAIYKNPRTAASRAMQDRARQMLNRALTLERSAEGFAFKGWILIDSGQFSLAESEFNKALKLNARNTIARKGLRQIQEHKEQEKKGLFRRMFT